jgi:molybdopterin adenylyltransferase
VSAHAEGDDKRWRIALIVLSDKAARGLRHDACLPALRAALPPSRFAIVREEVLADDRACLEQLLSSVCDRDEADGIFTSGGTGLSPRDITPEATLAIADYEVPGLADAMRNKSAQAIPTAMLSRAVAAVRGRTLIVNLPGSPKAIPETLGIISPVLDHAFQLLRELLGEHGAANAAEPRTMDT